MKNKKSAGHKRKPMMGSSKHNSVSGKYNSALKYYQAGDFQKAGSICTELLSVEPDNVDANHLLAIVAAQAGNHRLAVQLCNAAIREDASQAIIYNTLGYSLRSLKQTDEAVIAYEEAITISPDYADAHNNLGNVFKDSGRIDEAFSCYKKALSIKPDYAEAHSNMGSLYNDLGQLDEAIDCYKKALSIRPEYGEAYMHLLRLNTSIGTELKKGLEKTYENKNKSYNDRMFCGFALGKLYEKTKEYDKSFACYIEGNRLKRESYIYSSRDDYNLFEKIKQIFSTEYFLKTSGFGEKNESPVFIVGMPRSGTSLVEQILASHPRVFGAGELTYITHMGLNYFSDVTSAVFPEYMPELDASHLKKAGAYYIEKTHDLSQSEQYITDKMPHNFLFIGLIKSILPNAKIIHCVRNPMDNCLSIFKNYFGVTGSHKYAYELGELGRYYNLYLDLMKHWQDTLPGLIYNINYEELVGDQEGQTKKLLNYCGLSWDEACLEFYQTKRRVATLSNAQVRNPIYKDSIQLWKCYEAQLEPLRLAIYG